MWLVSRNQLHGANLRCTTQRAGREGIDKGLDGIGTLIELPRNTTHEMDNVTVVLQILIEINLYVMAVTAQVVTGQIYQHHVFGILLGVVTQILGALLIGLGIASTLCGAGNRVDVCLLTRNATMGFGT